MKNEKLVNEIIDLLVSNNLTFEEMSDVLSDVSFTIRKIVITKPVTFKQKDNNK